MMAGWYRSAVKGVWCAVKSGEHGWIAYYLEKGKKTLLLNVTIHSESVTKYKISMMYRELDLAVCQTKYCIVQIRDSKAIIPR